MTRLKIIFIIIIQMLAVSCWTDRAALEIPTVLLAAQEEFTSPGEAVVWLRGPEGRLSSHWVKNDVTGVIVVASRTDAVIPMNGGLWRFPTEDNLKDYDFFELEDLVTHETITIPLDDEAVDVTEEADGGLLDAGDSDDIFEESGNGEVDRCDTRSIQSLPSLLGGMGPYIFIKYEEREYDCQDVLVRAEYLYLSYNLYTQTPEMVMSTKEIEQFSRMSEVKRLGHSGDIEYMGSVPIYDGVSTARISHVFATRTAIAQDNGDRHWVVHSTEVTAKHLPRALSSYEFAPDLIQAFTIMYPSTMPAACSGQTATRLSASSRHAASCSTS